MSQILIDFFQLPDVFGGRFVCGARCQLWEFGDERRKNNQRSGPILKRLVEDS